MIVTCQGFHDFKKQTHPRRITNSPVPPFFIDFLCILKENFVTPLFSHSVNKDQIQIIFMETFVLILVTNLVD